MPRQRLLTYRRHVGENGRYVGAYCAKAFVASYYINDIDNMGWNTIGAEIGVDEGDGYPEGYARTEIEVRALLERRTAAWLNKKGLMPVSVGPESPLFIKWLDPHYITWSKKDYRKMRAK